MSMSVVPIKTKTLGKRCYIKCSYCRNSKQKCTPVDRTWPGQRCDNCILRGKPCSKPSFAGEPTDSLVPAQLMPTQFLSAQQQSITSSLNSNIAAGFTMPYVSGVPNQNGYEQITPLHFAGNATGFSPPMDRDIAKETCAHLEDLKKVAGIFVPEIFDPAIDQVEGTADTQRQRRLVLLSDREEHDLIVRVYEIRKLLGHAIRRLETQQEADLPDNENLALEYIYPTQIYTPKPPEPVRQRLYLMSSM